MAEPSPINHEVPLHQHFPKAQLMKSTLGVSCVQYVPSENTESRFQQNPLDNAVGRGARVLLETITRVLIKILSIVNLNKAIHILGSQLDS